MLNPRTVTPMISAREFFAKIRGPLTTCNTPAAGIGAVRTEAIAPL
jgi:hypothetical protein